MERTVVLVKPDGVKRGLVGEIVSRFEKVGLKIVAMKMIWVDEEHVKKHYPTTRTEWLKKLGERALESYKEYGRDPKEDLDSLEPIEIGKKMAGWLVDYFTEGPLVAMVLEGDNSILTVRKITGHTYGDKAVPGTIRGDYSKERGYTGFVQKCSARNLVHASGNTEEAEFEEKLWFRKNEIHNYKRADEDLIFG